MQTIDSLLVAPWIIPMEPVGVAVIDGAVAIDKGRILDVLPAHQADRKYAPAQREERPHHALIPGLINAHTHAAMVLLRGLSDDVALTEWLEEHIWPAEQRWVGPEFVRDGTELAIAEMLLSGTTCFNDMYYFPDIVAQTAIELGMRASVGMIAVEFPTPWADDAAECLTKGLAVHDQYREQPLISTAFAPHAPYTVADETLSKIRRFADQLDVPVHIHVQETAAEVTDSLAQFELRPLARLAEHGLLTPALMAVHMTQLSNEDLEMLVTGGASVVHCPRSNLKLASGNCPVAGLLAAGVNVALGTDGAASNNKLDMLGELNTAALLGKSVANDALAVKAYQALEMATINGARALGLGEQIGSLAAGKWADIVCLDLQRPATQPLHDPVSQIVYACDRSQVSDVWVAGRQLVAQGKLTQARETDIMQHAQDWQSRIADTTDD